MGNEINENSCEPCMNQCSDNRYTEEDFLKDPYYYMPESIWPEDATEIDNRPLYLRRRTSKLKVVKAVNEKNYEAFKECVEIYQKDHPGVEHPENNDDFWTKYVGEYIIYNALKNRDYIYTADNEDKHLRDEKLTKQFDVVIPETIVGYIKHPFVIYNIKYIDTYRADYELDEYGKNIINEYTDKLAEFKNDGANKRAHNEWRDLVNEKEKRIIELIKEGHVTWTVSNEGQQYYADIRWIDYKDGKKVLHKGIY